MRFVSRLSIIALALLLAACVGAPQQAVPLHEDAVSANAGRVGVAMTALPKPDTELPGAGCLLCIAAARTMNGSLIEYSSTLPHEDLPKLKNEVADRLRKRGLNVVVIAEDLDVKALPDFSGQATNAAKKDYSSLQKKHGIDRLVVIDITALGFERPYSNYVPSGDPKGAFRGVGYVVNLKGNTYEWYVPVVVLKSADQKWDEPPKFPGLTNAYFQALELGKDGFLKPLERPLQK